MSRTPGGSRPKASSSETINAGGQLKKPTFESVYVLLQLGLRLIVTFWRLLDEALVKVFGKDRKIGHPSGVVSLAFRRYSSDGFRFENFVLFGSRKPSLPNKESLEVRDGQYRLEEKYEDDPWSRHCVVR